MVYEILLPEEKDVLMGQSPNLRSHPGNAYLKALVQDRFIEYCAASKLAKTQIAKEIIGQIHGEGRRFLKQPEKKRIGSIQDSTWVRESDPVRIRDKVASQFRGLLKERNRRGDSPPRHDENHPLRNSVDNFPHKKGDEMKGWKTRSLPLKKRKIKIDTHADFKDSFNNAWGIQMKQPRNTARPVYGRKFPSVSELPAPYFAYAH